MPEYPAAAPVADLAITIQMQLGDNSFLLSTFRRLHWLLMAVETAPWERCCVCFNVLACGFVQHRRPVLSLIHVVYVSRFDRVLSCGTQNHANFSSPRFCKSQDYLYCPKSSLSPWSCHRHVLVLLFFFSFFRAGTYQALNRDRRQKMLFWSSTHLPSQYHIFSAL